MTLGTSPLPVTAKLRFGQFFMPHISKVGLNLFEIGAVATLRFETLQEILHSFASMPVF